MANGGKKGKQSKGKGSKPNKPNKQVSRRACVFARWGWAQVVLLCPGCSGGACAW